MQGSMHEFPTPHVASHPEWTDLTLFTWKKAHENLRLDPDNPARNHMDLRWKEDRDYQWMWDSCFMSLFGRYAPDVLPCMGSMDLFYQLQDDSGFIGMSYDFDCGIERWPGRINPPLFPWAEYAYWQTTGDASRLPSVLPHLLRHFSWLELNRKNAPHRSRLATDSPEDGQGESKNNYQLYWFEDGGSSGMDDSPRTPRLPEAGRFYDWIDLSSQMAFGYRLLAEMMEHMGDLPGATECRQRFESIKQLVNRELWCERTQFYHDRIIPSQWVSSKTAAGFWPMLAGISEPHHVRGLVQHLQNPDTFGGFIPVPSLSRDDPNFAPEGVYWRGSVWAPINYMVFSGLQQSGMEELCHELACRYLLALSEIFRNYTPSTLWECLAPDDYRPALTPYTREIVRPDFVGWSGLGPTAIFIEHVLGIKVAMARREITWRLHLKEDHGIDALRTGPTERTDMHCRMTKPGRFRITVKTDSHFTLNIRTEAQEWQVECSPGETSLHI